MRELPSSKMYQQVLEELDAPDETRFRSLLLELEQRLQSEALPGLAGVRAINDALGRYILGVSLTTVHGLGTALARSEQLLGERISKSVVAVELKKLVLFLMRSDGFVLSNHERFLRERFRVLFGGQAESQFLTWLPRYRVDVAAVARFLGFELHENVNGYVFDPEEWAQFMSALDISSQWTTAYEAASYRLYANPGFQDFMRGKSVTANDWVSLMQDIMALLSNPLWNKIG